MLHRAHAQEPRVGPDPRIDAAPRIDADPIVGGVAPLAGEPARDETLPPLTGMAELFHQLNNQLGIILANAELLELKARDDTSRARAAQVVSSVLEALATARSLRQHLQE